MVAVASGLLYLQTNATLAPPSLSGKWPKTKAHAFFPRPAKRCVRTESAPPFLLSKRDT